MMEMIPKNRKSDGTSARLDILINILTTGLLSPKALAYALAASDV